MSAQLYIVSTGCYKAFMLVSILGNFTILKHINSLPYFLYRYEKLLCGFAYANLCVSQAMKKDLARTLGIKYVQVGILNPS